MISTLLTLMFLFVLAVGALSIGGGVLCFVWSRFRS